MQFDTLALKFDKKNISILDQTALPHQEVWVDITAPQDCVDAIVALKVRGAPLIGIAAALNLAIFALNNPNKDQWLMWAERLRDSRPTAVNLIHHLQAMIDHIIKDCQADTLYQMAIEFFLQDQKMCDAMADFGAHELTGKNQILTHCNTGGLATAGVGTALGVIKKLAKNNPSFHVFVDETRPLLQGARLTAWELDQAGIPHEIVCDNMAGFLMMQNKVDAVITGADRIAKNGDTANKIGTYTLAVLCHFHKIPFYIAAPITTVDPKMDSGLAIPIELRNENEVKGFVGSDSKFLWSPKNSKAYNPAFDWVPNGLITGWITDQGVYKAKDIEKGCFTQEAICGQ